MAWRGGASGSPIHAGGLAERASMLAVGACYGNAGKGLPRA
jgi:hypothetical protein